jgi:hypothetical protein
MVAAAVEGAITAALALADSDAGPPVADALPHPPAHAAASVIQMPARLSKRSLRPSSIRGEHR